MAEERRIAAVVFPWLAAERLIRREPDLRRARLLLVASQRGRRVVQAVGPEAAAAGLAPGMGMADAHAMVPEAVAREADPEADRRALEGLADWCVRYTPWAAVADEATLFLDLTGSTHLFGGERATLDDLRRRLGGFGYSVRLALASTPGAAWALARFAADGIILPPRAPDRLREALAPLPTAALRLDKGAVEGLRRLGLARIGHLLDLPRAGLARRFGPEVMRRLDQALGQASEPIAPRQPPAALDVQVGFAEPIGRAEDIAAGLGLLLERLCRQMEEAGLGARRLDLLAYRVDGRVQTVAIGTARPNRSAPALHRLFREKLDRIAPGEGIEVLSLRATAAEPFDPTQYGFSGEGSRGEALVGLVDRLGNRLDRPVVRPAPRESWIPERAVRLQPALAPWPRAEPWPADRPRPLRLLSPPEPVEAMAPVPDDPPVQFRWRGRLHRIRAADGPERVAPEWWTGPAAADELRDYYRVEDQDGRRYWLFRRGLYVPGTSARWFLHGVFA